MLTFHYKNNFENRAIYLYKYMLDILLFQINIVNKGDQLANLKYFKLVIKMVQLKLII